MTTEIRRKFSKHVLYKESNIFIILDLYVLQGPGNNFLTEGADKKKGGRSLLPSGGATGSS